MDFGVQREIVGIILSSQPVVTASA